MPAPDQKLDKVTVIDPLPGMTQVLRREFEERNVATAASPYPGEIAEWLRTDSRLLVLTLDDAVGFPLFEELRNDSVIDRVLGLFDESDSVRAFKALADGIAMIALRSDESAHIVDVALASQRGHALLSTEMLRGLAQRARPDASLPVTGPEVDWLRRLAAGTTTHQLANELGYSERAMFRMLHDLYGRLGVANRQQALMAATRAGLLEESPSLP